jgi:hypothetical protein
MDAGLAEYAATALAQRKILGEEDVPVSIEDRMASWDAGAARESIHFVGAAFKEIGDEIKTIRPLHIRCADRESDEEEADEASELDGEQVECRRRAWIHQQRKLSWEKHDDEPPDENTPLV